MTRPLIASFAVLSRRAPAGRILALVAAIASAAPGVARAAQAPPSPAEELGLLAEEWTVERLAWSGEVDLGETLILANREGDLRLRQGPPGRVEVAAVVQRRVGDPDRPRMAAGRAPGGLTVEMAFPASGDPGVAAYESLVPRRRADWVAYVPPGALIVARAAAGLLEAKGLDNDLDLETISGDVVAATTGTVAAASERGAVAVLLRGTRWSRPPRLRTVTGDIRLELPARASARVTAVTAGEITTDYSLTIERPAPGAGGDPRKRAVASLGSGEQEVTIHTEIGNVKLLALPD